MLNRTTYTAINSEEFDGALQNVISIPACATKITLTAMNPASTGAYKIVGDFRSGTALTYAGAIPTATTLAGAGITRGFASCVGTITIAGPAQTEGGSAVVFTPTTSTETNLFRDDAYVTIIADGISQTQRYVSSVGSGTVNLGFASQGAVSAVKCTIIIHPPIAGVGFNVSAEFGVKPGRTGDIVTVVGTLPFDILTARLSGNRGDLLLNVTADDASTGTNKVLPKNYLLEITNIDIATSTIKVKDPNKILRTDARPTGLPYTFEGYISSQTSSRLEFEMSKYGPNEYGASSVVLNAGILKFADVSSTMMFVETETHKELRDLLGRY